MRAHIVSYCFLLDFASPEFSDMDGELDDCDEDNRDVEGDKTNILVIEQNYLELTTWCCNSFSCPFSRKKIRFWLVSESQ